MEITPLGDSALIVRVVEDFGRDPDASLDAVLAALHSLETAAIPGVVELAPAYSTIGVFFNAPEIARAAAGRPTLDWLTARIGSVLQNQSPPGREAAKTPVLEVPVCYDREFAFDVEDVARHAGVAEAEVVRRHASANYRVACVGFIAGFPFLSGLPPELATPRRDVPRKEVPAGSVAIGGAQTGIYPRNSPGGWNVIGRTPLRLFDIWRDPPTMLQAGDRVRFRQISRAEFDAFPQ